MMKNYHFIYFIKNKINGKGYVGQKSNGTLESRKKWYKRGVKKNGKISMKRLIFRALRKYGFDSFEWTILQKCYKIKSLNPGEAYWIRKKKTFFYDYPNEGYNLTRGGDGISGWKHSIKTRKLWSEHRCGKNNGMYGKGYLLKDEKNGMYHKHHTKESNEKNRESHKKLWEDEEYRKNHSGKNAPMYNKCQTKESNEKRSKTLKERWKDPNHKKRIEKLFKGENNPMYGRRKIDGVWYKLIDGKLMRV